MYFKEKAPQYCLRYVFLPFCCQSQSAHICNPAQCKKQRYVCLSLTKSRIESNAFVSAWSEQVFSIHSMPRPAEREGKSLGWEPRTLDMYCSTGQKVKSLSKHMLHLSSRPIISKWLCASPAWAATALLCWERIGARRGQKDGAQTKALCGRCTLKRRGRGRCRTCLLKYRSCISLPWDSGSSSEEELCCSVNRVKVMKRGFHLM